MYITDRMRIEYACVRDRPCLCVCVCVLDVLHWGMSTISLTFYLRDNVITVLFVTVMVNLLILF